MRRRMAVGALLAALAWGGAGEAAAADDAPFSQTLTAGGAAVTVTAREMSFAGQERRLTFRGDVRVTRLDHTLRARRLVVTLGDGAGGGKRIQRMAAEGDVVFHYGERTATAGHAVYDPNAETVVLTQDPKVTGPNMEVTGRRITIDLATRESTVEGGAFTFSEQP